MWILNAIIIHLLLLGSIFVIYFRSPVINGLQPQAPPIAAGLEAPAKRLVLIVTDGLRAESFFKNGCGDIPHIRHLMQQQGLVAISRTHVPTESRPGHIAMIAGLYEDPSAVTRGWKENPIDFDTVFNRSAHTYAWGANDVLHIFSRITSEQRMFIDAYDHDLDFSGKTKTYELDQWVFQKVRFYLDRKADELRHQDQSIYFLHLLGLDSAGHIHKPNSELFLENLHKTDEGIYEIYKHFQKIFPDNRTAFVLSSDHGMTNSGSHGAGGRHETETPFFMWGAGVENKVLTSDEQKTFLADESLLPLYDMEQAQIAPLMSALLGLPPPMNNFGILTRNFMNVSKEYYAHAAHSNALQLLEQFTTLLKEFEQGFFARYMKSFEHLNMETISAHIDLIEKHFIDHNFDEVLNLSYEVMQKALDGIDYYHSYYKNVLLISTTLTILGWMFYLFQLLTNDAPIYKKIVITRNSRLVIFIGLSILIFTILQRVPFVIALYIVLPIFVWLLPVVDNEIGITNRDLNPQRILKHFVHFFFLLFCIELLVFSFFNRKFISVVFLLFNFYHKRDLFKRKEANFYIWSVVVVTLAVFPLLPPSVGYKNNYLTVIGIVLIMGRTFFIKSGINNKLKLVPFVGIGNGLWCMYQHSQQIGISHISQIISWTFLLYSFGNIVFNNANWPNDRVEIVFFNLSTLYVLLCTSYEPVFVVLLCSELMLSSSAEESCTVVSMVGAAYVPPDEESENFLHSLRLSFSILLYTFFSFFGTGNIASVSSFDPNIIRCFLTTFSPFLIMTLVILKLVIPVLINICIVFGVSSFVRAYERQIFISMLMICDIMGLNFLFLVRNTGSWLEIGSSISHFVIMEVTTLVLLIITWLAKHFLKLNTSEMNGKVRYKVLGKESLWPRKKSY